MLEAHSADMQGQSDIYTNTAVQALPVVFAADMLPPVGGMMASDLFAHAKNIRVVLLGLLHQSGQHRLNLLLELPLDLMQLLWGIDGNIAAVMLVQIPLRKIS